MSLSPLLMNVLACPTCGGALVETPGYLRCGACAIDYPGGARTDLRVKKRKRVQITFDVPEEPYPEPEVALLRRHPAPAVDFSGIATPHHLTRELLSHFPKADRPDALALDLGCGSGLHRGVCEAAGFHYVGLDYAAPRAPLWGDAHALPFRDAAFDFVLSIAVLEHIQYPFLMMREVARVLRPGGRFIGTVAFLEPFHGDSYYHHTHLGTGSLLRHAGLRVERLAPSAEWSGLEAVASMALFPKMPRLLARNLLRPAKWAGWAWWTAASLVRAKGGRNTVIRNTTGAFSFVASKHASA